MPQQKVNRSKNLLQVSVANWSLLLYISVEVRSCRALGLHVAPTLLADDSGVSIRFPCKAVKFHSVPYCIIQVKMRALFWDCTDMGIRCGKGEDKGKSGWSRFVFVCISTDFVLWLTSGLITHVLPPTVLLKEDLMVALFYSFWTLHMAGSSLQQFCTLKTALHSNAHFDMKLHLATYITLIQPTNTAHNGPSFLARTPEFSYLSLKWLL